MASVATWSTTAASNTSVGGISTDGNVTLVNQIDNMFRGQMAEVATSRDDGTIINVYPRGYLHGLTLSNNSGDATNDIDISAGECVSDTSPYWRMALASALTKRLDAAWAVGTGNGGLDTGAIANTTYHVWLIARSDTGVVDALFSTSATSPTMPASYDRKRRIGSIIRAAAAIRTFHQVGDQFDLDTPVVDRSSTAAAASALFALTVPAGINCRPMIFVTESANASSSSSQWLGSPGLGDTSAVDKVIEIASPAGGIIGISLSAPPYYVTNTSRQLYYAHIIASGTSAFSTLTTTGWIDTRGKDA